MKTITKVMAMLSLVSLTALGVAEPNKPAPGFEAQDAKGETRTLAQSKGKWVVLEWFNKDCPYVQKHYGSKNMQALQKKYTAKGVTWLQVLSSAPAKEGHMSGSAMLQLAKEEEHAATAALLDPDGTIGKAYGAKTTPHMFVIDPKGMVVYAGAIDDNDSSDPSVIPTSKNYVAAALDGAMAGKSVEVSATKSYGCSVKYAK